MATTTPDNIQYPVNSDQVAPLASHFKNLADTTQAALVNKASETALATEVTNRTNADTALQNQINDIKQTSRMYVKNGSTALTKGTPVYITGANGTNVIVGAASNATEGTSSKVIGLLETDLAINAMGYVVTAGLCTNIDTSGAGAAGDPVWLGVDGAKIYGLSNKPSAPAHLVYLGVVSKKNASTGEIEVRVQNGFELEELHNVQINSGTLATGQALTYDASTSLWKNSTPVSSLAGLSDVTLTDPEANEVLKYNGTDWVNGTAAGGVTAAATAPDLVAAKQGDAWFDTNDGTLYVCYIDPDSTKQWVQVQANSALEGSILARLGSLESQAIAFGSPSPNYIINGGFDIWQRGTSSGWVNGYNTADRWYMQAGASTSWAQEATLVAPGTRYSIKATTAATVQPMIYQAIETANAINLAGKTVTLSAYMASSVSTPGYLLVEYSTNVDNALTGVWTQITGVATSNLTTSMVRYSGNFAVPSTAKSIRVLVATNSTIASGNTFTVGGVQLEVGSTATAFRRNQPNIQAELAACQRYYQQTYPFGYGAGTTTNAGALMINVVTTGNSVRLPVKLGVNMRVAPVVNLYGPGTGAAGYWQYEGAGTTSQFGGYVTFGAEGGFLIYATAATVAGGNIYIHYTASAEL